MNEISQKLYDGFVPLPMDVAGWVRDASVLESFVREVRPRVIVEVGSWKGASTIVLGQAAKRLGLDCKIYCIDTWLGGIEFWTDKAHKPDCDLMLQHGYPQAHRQFLSNIVHAGLQDLVIPLPMTSSIGVSWLAFNAIRPDLVYIDGSHDYFDVFDDVRKYYWRAKPGAVIFGDDYGNSEYESVRNGVDDAARVLGRKVTTRGNGWYWAIKKN